MNLRINLTASCMINTETNWRSIACRQTFWNNWLHSLSFNLFNQRMSPLDGTAGRSPPEWDVTCTELLFEIRIKRVAHTVVLQLYEPISMNWKHIQFCGHATSNDGICCSHFPLVVWCPFTRYFSIGKCFRQVKFTVNGFFWQIIARHYLCDDITCTWWHYLYMMPSTSWCIDGSSIVNQFGDDLKVKSDSELIP